LKISTKKIAYSGLFTALTAVGAFIRIPMPLVPFTMQTFFVYTSGSILGAGPGFMSQLVYLLLGLSGLPVFAHGGGPGYIFKPTFGYLLAYPLASLFVGKLINSIKLNKTTGYRVIFEMILVMFGGSVIIYFFGVIYLYINSIFIIHKKIPFLIALWSGFVIFIPVDLIKIFFASWLTLRVKRSVKIVL